MVLLKNWPFFHLFLKQYWLGKCLSPYSSTKKRLSNLQKQQVQKVETSKHLPKRLACAFDQQLTTSPSISFRQFKEEKCFSRYSRTKKRRSIQ